MQGADIIVFPEYGLSTLAVPRDRNSSKPYLQLIPSIGSNPCDAISHNSEFSSKITNRLSCTAKNSSIYLVANLGEIRPCDGKPNCPADGVFQYNVNVVFAKNGTIVAKYAKQHLYFENQFDAPNNDEQDMGNAIFETDFGVKFGVFICFDIIFYKPAIQMAVDYGISSFIFTSAWVDELPFLTGKKISCSNPCSLTCEISFRISEITIISDYRNPSSIHVGICIQRNTFGIRISPTYGRSNGQWNLLQTIWSIELHF